MPIQKKHSPGPDQAIGWLVVLACFSINFIMAGLARSAGVLYLSLINLHGVSRGAATIPFSIRVCVRNMTGPLIGLLGLKYGIRKVTTVGGFVAAFGSILCYFAPDILWITVFWGVIHGIGFGLSTVIHMMIINQYFDKYKASALGLGYSGDCFGTFAFPVIMEYLLTHYNVKETFLILGGIVLNVIPMALLLRKPLWMRRKKKKKPRKASRNIAPRDIGTVGKECEGYRNEAFLNYDEDLAPPKTNDDETPHANKVEFDKVVQLHPYEDSPSASRFNNLKSDRLSANGSVRSIRTLCDHLWDNPERHDSLPPGPEKEPAPTGSSGFEGIAFDDITPDYDDPTIYGREQRSASMKKRASSFMGQMAVDIVHRMRTASFVSQVAQDGFISNFQQGVKNDSDVEDQYDSEPRKLSLDENGCCKNCGQVVVLSVNDPRLEETREPSQLSFPVHKSVGILETLISTNIKPIFVLISASMAVYGFLFIGVLTIIIDYAVDQGVSNDQGKYLVIGFSVTDLFGRLTFGQIIDRKLVKMKNYSGTTMLLMGTLVAVIPFNKSFNFMMVSMCLYGFVQGGTAIMFPILVSHYMDKNEESVAMGCLNFYGGLLMLCLAPMIGYFRDNTGSYNWVFHIQGGMVALIGIVWQMEPLILKFQRKQQLKQQLKRANHVVTFKL